MADYSGAYERFDPTPAPKQNLKDISIGMQTSILRVRESKVTTIDFGEGPFKVEQFQELARLLKDFPPGARVAVEQQAWDDGETFKVTIST